jgi:hypothetical protein
MSFDDEVLVSLYQSLINVEGQIFAHLELLPIGILALRPQLDRNAILTPALAGHCVPDVATPAPLRPLNLIDGIRLGGPLSHVRERL